MNNDLRLTIEHMRALVDSYHGANHTPADLIALRRELAVYQFRLTAHIKGAYGRKALSYVMRKYAVAREVSRAIEDDKSASKKRPMNQLETQTEALDSVLQLRKEQIEAEAAYEEVVEVIRSSNQVLAALQQEIAAANQERKNTHYQNEH